MHGINLTVIEAVCRWLEQGEPVWYVTIVHTWGASPRPAGSIFAFNPQQDLVAGSLSGGCVEEDLLHELLQRSAESRPFYKLYGESPEDQARFQLPCGGRLELVIEHLLPIASHKDHFFEIERCLRKRQRVKRVVSVETGDLSLTKDPGLPCVQSEENTLIHILGPQDRLLIIGMGEVTRYLAPMAELLEFSVVVCDPRESFMNRSSIDSESVELKSCLPDDLIQAQFNDEYCAIVALAHDPRVDDLGLIAALETKAFFIGAMGSRKTTANRNLRLRSLGLSEEKLSRLHAPIGMPVGSKTPPEIAISIAAQLIEQRACRAKNNN